MTTTRVVLAKGPHAPAGSFATQCQSAWLSIAHVRVPRRSYSRITTCNPMPPRIPHLRFRRNANKSKHLTTVSMRMNKIRRTCSGTKHKEPRALPLITDSLPATSSSPQLLDETLNTLLRSLKQAKKHRDRRRHAGKCLLFVTERLCEHERNGFLQVLMVETHSSVTEKH